MLQISVNIVHHEYESVPVTLKDNLKIAVHGFIRLNKVLNCEDFDGISC